MLYSQEQLDGPEVFGLMAKHREAVQFPKHPSDSSFERRVVPTISTLEIWSPLRGRPNLKRRSVCPFAIKMLAGLLLFGCRRHSQLAILIYA